MQNTQGAPAAFSAIRYKKKIKGLPDLTITSLTLGDKIMDWNVTYYESHSDHKYIKFKIK